MASVAGRSTQSLEGMSRRTNIVIASCLIFGAVVASGLFVSGIAKHIGCGPALSYDYDTGACEPSNEHPSSKDSLGTIVVGLAALGMGIAGVVLLVRNRRLR